MSESSHEFDTAAQAYRTRRYPGDLALDVHPGVPGSVGRRTHTQAWTGFGVAAAVLLAALIWVVVSGPRANPDPQTQTATQTRPSVGAPPSVPDVFTRTPRLRIYTLRGAPDRRLTRPSPTGMPGLRFRFGTERPDRSNTTPQPPQQETLHDTQDRRLLAAAALHGRRA